MNESSNLHISKKCNPKTQFKIDIKIKLLLRNKKIVYLQLKLYSGEKISRTHKKYRELQKFPPSRPYIHLTNT